MKKVTKRIGFALLSASAAATALVGPASASGSPYSTLLASETAITVDLNTAATTNTNPHAITVALDSATCLASLNKGQNYGIAVQGTAYASVSPTSVNGLKCGSTAPTFTITGLQVTPSGTPTTLLFEAVGKNKGIDNKLGDVTVSVTVIDTSGIIVGCTSDCPVLDGGQPAAPAVANSYLNGGGVAEPCQTKYGKNWRGTVISHIADWMPRPESQKDTWAATHGGQTWWAYVTSEVDSYCAP